MARLPRLKHVKYVRAKGRLYAYFNTGQTKAGRPIYARLPPPSSVGFHDSYAAMLGARTKRQRVEYTIADLARDYENSAKFGTLAKGSQILYTKTIRRIVETLGEFPVNDLESNDLRTVLDNEMSGPGAHNIFVAVLGVLYKWARDRDRTALKPTEGIDKLRISEHEPWPDAILEEALRAEHDRTRLAVHLLYFTGQRIGDVVRMRWSDIRDGAISIVQQKRGKEVWIPLLSELRDELERTPKRGFTILTNYRGQPVSDEIIRKELKRFTALRGVETVPHGLRKNAVIAFLEAGCTPHEVAAITGQTIPMVTHYAARINQRTLSKAAVLKLENKRRAGKPIGKPAAKAAE